MRTAWAALLAAAVLVGCGCGDGPPPGGPGSDGGGAGAGGAAGAGSAGGAAGGHGGGGSAGGSGGSAGSGGVGGHGGMGGAGGVGGVGGVGGQGGLPPLDCADPASTGLPGPVESCGRDPLAETWEPFGEVAADADGSFAIPRQGNASSGIAGDGRWLVWLGSPDPELRIADVRRRLVRRADLARFENGQKPLAVHGDLLAFSAVTEVVDGQATVAMVLLNLSTGVWGRVMTQRETPATRNFLIWHNLSFDGRRIAWDEISDLHFRQQVVAFDLLTGEKLVVPQDAGRATERPKLGGDWLVFSEYDGPLATVNVVALNLLTNERRRITASDTEKGDLATNGRVVVWTEDTSGPDGPGLSYVGDLWLHDLQTGETRSLVVAPSVQANASLSGDRLLWMDLRDGGFAASGSLARSDLYFLDLARGEELRVGTTPHAREGPRLLEGFVAWREVSDRDFEVWLTPWVAPP